MSTNKFTTNNNPTLAAVSNADGESVVYLYADPTTHGLVVSSSGGGGGAVTIADGADVALGTIADSAVTAGSTGTVSGKLRQISSDIATSNTLMATSANQTNGTQQTKITDGTNIANVLKSDGTVTGQNAALISGTGMSTATLTLNAGSPSTAWFDMLNYSWVSVEILTNTTPATLTWQTSGDASQTNASGMYLQTGNSVPALTTTSTTATFHGPRNGRYFRVSSNVAGGNTVTLVVTFFTFPSIFPVVQSAQNGTWTVGSNAATGSAVPANAFYAGISDGTNLRGILGAANALNSTGTGVPTAQIVGQFDDVSPTSITENQFGNVRMSTNRNLYGTIRDAAGNERGVNVNASNQLEVNGGGVAGTALNTYSVHLTANATTTPTSSTAYISSIAISNEVGGTTSTVTIQDKQGTPLKLINGIATTALTTAPTVINFQTPVKMVSGIDIITAGAVAATVDVWINYYQ